MKKIIIFRTDRLGDYLINSRPIYELKKKISNSRIIVVCSQINEKILKQTDYIDQLIIYDKKFSVYIKLKIFFSIIFQNYYSAFILDGKNFSYLCNIFLFSKFKFGIFYLSSINFFTFKINFHKPSRLYNFFFFTKYECITSRKFLKISENFCQKYISLFNFFNLNLKPSDNYIFQTTKVSEDQFETIKKTINLKDYILIHFDEKWLDIIDLNHELIESIENLFLEVNKTIILTSYNNDFKYFEKMKNYFTYFNLKDNNNFENLLFSNIIILDNLEIFLFEHFLKNSFINISCHSGFVVQVCGANKGKLIDIINEKDFKWYECWKPLNTFHKFVFKSTYKTGHLSPSIFFREIANIIKNL
jgi:ADP-heptose:LPS heptosyltransferase